MKPKKPYSGKYPVLFYQPWWNQLRIFYPNGRSDYSHSGVYSIPMDEMWNPCCFRKHAKSIDDLVLAANEYDDLRVWWSPMEFIGEIK